MFSQSTLTEYKSRTHKVTALRTIQYIAVVGIIIGALFTDIKSAFDLFLTALLVIGLFRISRFFLSPENVLWEAFTRSMPLKKSFIESPLLGKESHTAMGRYGLDTHHTTTIESYPARFDTVTAGYQIFGYDPERHYSDKGSTSFSLTYLVFAVDLKVPVPHLFIDGRSQNRFGRKKRDLWSLTKKLSRSNKLQDLEGDFYKYFDVYAASKKQVEALSIVTPDVMITLRDQGFSFDYELHDTSLYVIAEPQLKSPEDYEAYTQAVVSALTELVPQITKHHFSSDEPDMPVHTNRLAAWAILYSLQHILYVVTALLVLLVMIYVLSSLLP
ncbi:MAG: hypothetical protein ABWX90_02320 [Candidatus Saccharimonadales bacterium]